MDDFVCNKLSEWGLSDLIETFKDQGINQVHFYDLEDEEIKELIPKVGPRKTFKRHFKLLKDLPSTSEANDTRNMDMDPREESSQCQSPSVKRKRPNSAAEESIALEVKTIMKDVKMKLQKEKKTKLNDFLKNKISDLETRKRMLVGVFGRTGAGKSSLINAIVGEMNLLPSGSVCACTSVIFKVEANNDSKKYEAEIEFIKKEDWKEELWFYKNLLEDDDDDAREKMTALYRTDWESKSVEELMDKKYFKEIPEFLSSDKKKFKCDSAEELRDKTVKYISASYEEDDGVRQYWPLVECVTVRLPNKDLLQHVTLVDLPGNGDRNKTRNNMWKKMVESCSTVWIVADINRAVADKEAWEILQNASSLMGNGGECQHIHFICTKSDDVGVQSGADVRVRVLKRNEVAKRQVNKEFKKEYKQCSEQFSFEVFTVSCKEFHSSVHLESDDTEIPKLREVLQSLNNSQSEALNYVSGARGILSLIQGTRCREVDYSKMKACSDLEEKMQHELKVLQKAIDEIYRTFERCLTEGVKESQDSCEGQMKSTLHPGKKGGAFHKTLKFAVMNNGAFKAKKGRKKNINTILSSKLTGCIDDEFRMTFPNEDKSGPFKGAIDSFSLDTEGMINTYKDIDLQLRFLKTEEDKLKTKLKKIIREDKKKVYSSLTETIEENMQKCYTDATKITGVGSLEKMRSTINNHVHDKKDTMFQMAKDNMLKQLKKLKGKILETLEGTLMESIERSLWTDDCSFPDVSRELDRVETFYSQLEANQNPN